MSGFFQQENARFKPPKGGVKAAGSFLRGEVDVGDTMLSDTVDQDLDEESSEEWKGVDRDAACKDDLFMCTNKACRIFSLPFASVANTARCEPCAVIKPSEGERC